MFEADFDVEVIGGVVVIYDQDAGSTSVTNDVRGVLRRVSRRIQGIGNRPVIYRDSTKTFDGISHESGSFVGFYPIGETVLEAAITRAKKLRESSLDS